MNLDHLMFEISAAFVVSIVVYIFCEHLNAITDNKIKRFINLGITVNFFLFEIFIILIYSISEQVDSGTEKISKQIIETHDINTENLSAEEIPVFKDLISNFRTKINVRDSFDFIQNFAIKQLRECNNELESGKVYINREYKLVQEIGNLYLTAQKSIFATNDGDLDKYFENSTYISRNITAIKNNRKIFRVYFYNSNDSIKFRKNISLKGKRQFLNAIKILHDTLKTTVSVVVDLYQNPKYTSTDILLVDGRILCVYDKNKLINYFSRETSELNSYKEEIQRVMDYNHDTIFYSEKVPNLEKFKNEIRKITDTPKGNPNIDKGPKY